jgi:hypothetical protein
MVLVHRKAARFKSQLQAAAQVEAVLIFLLVEQDLVLVMDRKHP